MCRLYLEQPLCAPVGMSRDQRQLIPASISPSVKWESPHSLARAVVRITRNTAVLPEPWEGLAGPPVQPPSVPPSIHPWFTHTCHGVELAAGRSVAVEMQPHLPYSGLRSLLGEADPKQ